MFNDKTILAIIPARGGSKGVPRKNIRELGGKPLIAWTIEAAKKSRYLERLILSSEDDEIIEIAEQWECEVPFRRPAYLAQDDTPGIDVVLHALNALKEKYDYVMLLQPTSPLRSSRDIDESIEFCMINNSPVCVSVCEARESPYWMFRLDGTGRMHPILSHSVDAGTRQELEKVYRLNGAIYLAQTDYLMDKKSFKTPDTIAFLMPGCRSIDIDTEQDFLYCDLVLANK